MTTELLEWLSLIWSNESSMHRDMLIWVDWYKEIFLNVILISKVCIKRCSQWSVFYVINSGLLEDQVRLKDEEIRNKMTKRPITPPPSHSHMMPAEPLPEIIPPKQEFRQDVVLPRPEMSQPNPIREPVPKVGQYKQNNDNVLIMIIRFEK